MAQLAINVSLSNAKPNYVLSSEVEHPVKFLVRFATGFLDFAWNDRNGIRDKF
jgi:hypothetical protein